MRASNVEQESTVRIQAVRRLGDEGAQAVPGLLAALEDSDVTVRDEAAGMLRRLGPDAVEELIKAYGDENASTRRNAVVALGSLGSTAQEAVATLKVAAMRDVHLAVRLAAITALAEIAGDDPAVVEHLGKLLDDPRDAVQNATIAALRKIGPDANEAVPSVLDQLRSTGDPRLQARMGDLLAANGKDSVPTLIEALSDPKKHVRVYVAVALQDIGADARAAIPALSEALEDDDARVQAAAAATLVALKASPEDVMPKLVKLAEQLERQFRETIAALNQHAGPVSTIEAVSALRSHETPTVRRLAEHGVQLYSCRRGVIDSIGRIGPAAGQALPLLERAMEDEDHRIATSAAVATWKISGRADVAGAILQAQAKPGLPRGPGMDALEEMGERALPAMLRASKSPNARLREAAASALGRLGPKAVEAEDALSGLLADSDLRVRLRASESHWRVTGRPTEAVPALASLLEASDNQVAHSAAQVLAEMGPAAKSALPALRKASRASYTELAIAAMQAIERIEGKAEGGD